MERWLHQHIFKVGWLVTKNYQTTTVLYYTFFLPGVVLHEFVYWLAAGILNVRAERAIAFPEKQEIGDLKLNFIRLSKKASPLQVAIISMAPPLVGLFVIWWIATNIFRIQDVLATVGSGEADALSSGLSMLLATSDFWLWLYFAVTISNTMMPSRGALQGWRPVLVGLGIFGLILLVAGLADDIGAAVVEPLVQGINGVSTVFGIIIAVDLVFTAILAVIENTIERITGDSATFKNGKMITLRRSELLEQRKAERERALKQQRAAKQAPALPSGPPSIYRMPLPVPAFGGIPISQLPDTIFEHEVEEAPPERIPRDAPASIPAEPVQPSMPLFNPGRTRDAEAEAEVEESAEKAAAPDEQPLGSGIRINPPRGNASESSDQDADRPKVSVTIAPPPPDSVPAAESTAESPIVRTVDLDDDDEDDDMDDETVASASAEESEESGEDEDADDDEIVYEDIEDDTIYDEDEEYDDYDDEDYEEDEIEEADERD